MNNNIKDLLNKYVEKFEYINNKDNREYYKWELAQAFQKLDLDSGDFVSQLKWLLKKSSNLIDSSTYPFYAIIKYAEKEPETVRKMFKELFAPTSDLTEKTSRIYAFVDASESLRKKYHFSQRYENNLRSVLQYLFFRNPDENYMYKATEAQDFADCFEYYDSWGPMNQFRIEKYYRMCDMLVEEIKNHPALVATNKSRYDMPGLDLHPDENLHLLAFDIIYSAYHYGFYTGMNIKPIDSKARKLHKERVEKAKNLLKELEIAQRNYEL